MTPDHDNGLETLDPRLTLHDPVSQLASERLGIPYLFPYQRIVVANILDRAFAAAADSNDSHEIVDSHDRPRTQLVILPTGAGKSLCFQLPSLLLPGLTVVVFPLLSLIEDQRRRLAELGIPGVVLRGGQTHAERERALAACRDGSVRIVLTNPETALTEPILAALARARVTHIVIDEAHCVSEWGETFRPRYLELYTLCQRLPTAAVTAFTATASPVIREGIVRHLFSGEDPQLVEGLPDRPNIRYRVLSTLSTQYSLRRLLTRNSPDAVERPAVVFCPTRRRSEETARLLRTVLDDQEIYFYHAGLTREEKLDRERWFFASTDGVLCATTAYGMGVDKKNIRTVMHLELSPSVESYLQESGRAGRDGKPSAAVLLDPLGGPAGERARRERTAFEQARAAMMRGYLTAAGCRREYLLSALGAELEYCAGCDRCDGVAHERPERLEALLGFFAVHGAALSRKAAVATLGGLRDLTAQQHHAAERRGYGLLAGWTELELGEALRGLERAGLLRTSRRGLFKGRLRLTPAGRRAAHGGRPGGDPAQRRGTGRRPALRS